MDKKKETKMTRKEALERIRIRQAMFNRALSGDEAALIFLGKKYLGQK